MFGADGTVLGSCFNGTPIDCRGRIQNRNGPAASLAYVGGAQFNMEYAQVYEEILQLAVLVLFAKQTTSAAAHARHRNEVFDKAFLPAESSAAQEFTSTF